LRRFFWCGIRASFVRAYQFAAEQDGESDCRSGSVMHQTLFSLPLRPIYGIIKPTTPKRV
jgi:hypothetical protein